MILHLFLKLDVLSDGADKKRRDDKQATEMILCGKKTQGKLEHLWKRTAFTSFCFERIEAYADQFPVGID
jgi:hypothetical protein